MFFKIIKQNYVVVFSAILCAYAYTSMNLFILFFSWAPFFYQSLKSSSLKTSLFTGAIFGFFYGIGLFSWIHFTLQDYSSNKILGTFVVVVLAFLYAIIYSLFSLIIYAFKNQLIHIKNFLKGLALVAVLTLIEELLSFLLQGIPFLNSRLGFTVSKSLYLSQFAKIGGVAILTFLVFANNYIVVISLINKNIKKGVIKVVGFCVLIFGLGFLQYQLSKTQTHKEVKIAVISGNIHPKVSWNAATGNTLVNNYFNLTSEANKEEPDFIIYPESTIPWLFNEKDDFIRGLQKRVNNKIHLVVGNNVQLDKSYMTNSVVFLSSKEGKYAQYNKNVLLKAIEEPLFKCQIPFFINKELKFRKHGSYKPINTQSSNIGVLVCNEAIEEQLVRKQVENGAEAFFVLSNDGWFKDSYISHYHFYISRIMAIAFKRSFSISNNCGTSGFINSKGEFLKYKNSTTPLKLTQNIEFDKTQTFYAKFPFAFIISLIVIIKSLKL